MSDETWLLSMLFGFFVVLPVGYCLMSWLSGNRNSPAGDGTHGDNIIRSDVPGHPEYATQRAAEIVNQRMTGRNLGDDLQVYVSTEQADEHSQRRYTDWMTENGRAASVGVHVHKVSADERDRISAMRGSGSQTWINTAETAPAITETHSGGIGKTILLIAACLFVGAMCAAPFVYIIRELP